MSHHVRSIGMRPYLAASPAIIVCVRSAGTRLDHAVSAGITLYVR